MMTSIPDLIVTASAAGTLLTAARLLWRARRCIHVEFVYDGKVVRFTISFDGGKPTCPEKP